MNRNNLKIGDSYNCGEYPRGYPTDHNPSEKHIATVVGFDTDSPNAQVKCTCGYSWSIPKQLSIKEHN